MLERDLDKMEESESEEEEEGGESYIKKVD